MNDDNEALRIVREVMAGRRLEIKSAEENADIITDRLCDEIINKYKLKVRKTRNINCRIKWRKMVHADVVRKKLEEKGFTMQWQVKEKEINLYPRTIKTIYRWRIGISDETRAAMLEIPEAQSSTS